MTKTLTTVALLLALQASSALAQVRNTKVQLTYYKESAGETSGNEIRVFHFRGNRACVLNEYTDDQGAVTFFSQNDWNKIAVYQELVRDIIKDRGYTLQYAGSELTSGKKYTKTTKSIVRDNTGKGNGYEVTYYDTYTFSPDNKTMIFTRRESSMRNMGRVITRHFKLSHKDKLN